MSISTAVTRDNVNGSCFLFPVSLPAPKEPRISEPRPFQLPFLGPWLSRLGALCLLLFLLGFLSFPSFSLHCFVHFGAFTSRFSVFLGFATKMCERLLGRVSSLNWSRVQSFLPELYMPPGSTTAWPLAKRMSHSRSTCPRQ